MSPQSWLEINEAQPSGSRPPDGEDLGYQLNVFLEHVVFDSEYCFFNFELSMLDPLALGYVCISSFSKPRRSGFLSQIVRCDGRFVHLDRDDGRPLSVVSTATSNCIRKIACELSGWFFSAAKRGQGGCHAERHPSCSAGGSCLELVEGLISSLPPTALGSRPSSPPVSSISPNGVDRYVSSHFQILAVKRCGAFSTAANGFFAAGLGPCYNEPRYWAKRFQVTYAQPQ